MQQLRGACCATAATGAAAAAARLAAERDGAQRRAASVSSDRGRLLDGGKQDCGRQLRGFGGALGFDDDVHVLMCGGRGVVRARFEPL
jgi:hypothetical protein